MCDFESRNAAAALDIRADKYENGREDISFIAPSATTTTSSSTDDWSIEMGSDWWNAKVWSAAWRPPLTVGDVWRRMPWMVLVFGLAQLFIFACNLESVHRLLSFSVASQTDYWRYFSYSLLHSSSIHLGINLVVQLFVGTPLEMEQGHLRTLLVYVSSVIAGAIASSRFQPAQTLVGASAGGFGMLTSHLAHTILNFRILPYRYYRLSAVAIFCASDWFEAVFNQLFARYFWLSRLEQRDAPVTSVCAHMGGALCGILVGVIIYSGHRGVVMEVLRVFAAALIVTMFAYVTLMASHERLKLD